MVMNKKGDVDIDTLVFWIIAILVLVVFIGGMFILKGKGVGALDYIKELFRFGR